MARRVVVLGSNSFSGSDFVDLLLDDPLNDVLGISRSAESSPAFLRHMQRCSPRYRFARFDLNADMASILRALDAFEPQYVVNFAAQSEVLPSWEHPDHWFQTNTVALAKLINHLQKRSYLKRYVHISSPEVYGSCEGTVLETAPLNPSTPYAASKAAADLLLATYRRAYDMPIVWIRATNVYGEGQQLFKIIPRSVVYAKLGTTIELHGGGRAIKSYIHIRDVSQGELAAMLDGCDGELYHLSPDRGYSVREVVQTICAALETDFASATRDVGERLGQDAAYVIDSTKARDAFGWRPQIGLAAGIDRVVGWVNEAWSEILERPLTYVHRE